MVLRLFSQKKNIFRFFFGMALLVTTAQDVGGRVHEAISQGAGLREQK
jgi:hypothetical protein